MPLEFMIASIIFLALTLYSVTGGADFGGGVWDLFAIGPRASRQRKVIARAISPIWEANHVWLIAAVVSLFIAFPRAYAIISTALHIPITLMLIGIVLRGSAFTFRSYGIHSDRTVHKWGMVFAISSIITPITLGLIVGAIASGTIRIDAQGKLLTGFISSWLAPFPFAIGIFTLVLFAFLAAAYLTSETHATDLQEDFRLRALITAVLAGIMALICFLLADQGAPEIRKGLFARWWSIPFHLATAASALGAIWALWQRRYQLARFLAAVQVALVVLGWGFSQYPYLVVPDITVTNSAAPPSILHPMLIVLAIGLAIILPSFWWLYSIFKKSKYCYPPPGAKSAKLTIDFHFILPHQVFYIFLFQKIFYICVEA